MKPNDIADWLPLWGGIWRYYDSASHTFDHRFKTESPATAYAKNVRLMVIRMDTLNPFSDLGHTTYCNNFNSQSLNTVYIQSCYFEASTSYYVGYYDNGGAKVSTDGGVTSDANGVVNSQWYFPGDQGATPGTWHAVIYKSPTTPPATYTANDPNSIRESTFTVTQEAIPEFPTVFAAVGVGGLCFAIYWWMRKRTAVSKQ